MDLLLTIVVYLVVFCLVAWLASIAPIDGKYKQVLYFVLAAVFVIVLIRLFMGGGRLVVVG